ncbi:hypothetical protein PIB30_007900 [Stylosanthes scabra]|uniref:Uncharacterized protein n=1 Tax=Stylosanthes scabra TaxID=79078 RepID=A0ABU6S5A0_9FABA|nr:hypothetical protein [Stylosanthes scabra]
MEQPKNLLRGYEETLYRLDAVNHIAGRIAHMEPRFIGTQRNTMRQPDERIRDLLRQAGFEHVASMIQEMSITLQGVAYQLGLRIDGDPVSGCISGWEAYYDGRGVEAMCLELLGAFSASSDGQKGKWNVNLSWFQDTN